MDVWTAWIECASGGSWPDGQSEERWIRALRAQPAPLARAAGGKERDVPPAGPGRTGSRQEREREMRAQPAPLARAAGGKRDVG